MSPSEVRIGGALARVNFAGLAPGLAGVFQLNVVVPGGLRAGLQDVMIGTGSDASVSGRIAVR